MKTIIMLQEKRTQLVLQAESEYDTKVLKTLGGLPNTHWDNFYACQGGYTRQGDGDRDLVIVFDNKEAL